MKNIKWNKAINLLIEVIDYEVKDYKFKVASKTTNNFEKFKEETEKNGYILVSSEGCDNTIYKHPYINIKARVFHDKYHLIHNLDFS